MRKKISFKGVVFLVALFFGLSPVQSLASDLHIAVASNFKSTLKRVLELIQPSSASAKIHIITSSGSTGVLYAQIQNGAPFDVFLSADELRPDRLIKEGFGLETSRKIYARGQIALWRKTASNAPMNIQLLSNHKQRYTLANPKLAPYGAAAKLLMQKSGNWQENDKNRVMAQNIAGAFQYLASDTVKLGWVALSQLKAWQKNHPVDKQNVWIPPLNDYPAINQVALILREAKHPANAARFMEKLSAPDVQSLIKSQGYLIPTRK